MNTEESDDATAVHEAIERRLEIESVAVRRMIEEIRSGDPVPTSEAYNRTYNRHNR